MFYEKRVNQWEKISTQMRVQTLQNMSPMASEHHSPNTLFFMAAQA